MYLNKVILVGNLTKDPELKSLTSGVSVCSFSIATNKTFKDKSGNKQEKVEFHSIVVFGKQAENVSHYMKKGSQIMVEGELTTRSWEDKDGKKQYRTEVLAQSIQFGSKKQSSGQNEPKNDTSEQVYGNGIDSIDLPEDEINPEDIPF